MELAPQPQSLAAEPGLALPGTGSLPSPWLAARAARADRRCSGACAARGARRPPPPGPAASGSSPRWTGPRPASPSRCGSSSRRSCGRGARSSRSRERGQLQSVRYRGEVPHLFDTLLYGPVQRGGAARRRWSPAACSPAASAPTPPICSRCSCGLLVAGPDGGARMSALAGAIQVVGGLALAPLLPGTIQTLKARLQGRRGPSPLQPYRELRRLWGKTLVDPQPTTVVYRLAPCLVAAATVLALFLVPVAGLSPGLAARQRRARPRRPARPGALRPRRGELGHRRRLRADGVEPRPDPRGLRRGAAGPGAAPRRAARRQHRPGGDERRRERLRDLERAGPLVRRASPSPSSSSSRPGASRSTTPTPTSS